MERAGRRRAAPALLRALLATLLLLARPTACLEFVTDELLWMKQQWGEYRLPFPWAAVLKRRDPEATRQLQGPLAGIPAHSLNGPLLDASALAQRMEEDTRRSAAMQQGSVELALLLETDVVLDTAADVAQCKVCGALAARLWGGLVHWVNVRRAVPSRKRVAAYAAELCQYEVPNDVLESWVLLRARVQQGAGLPFAAEAKRLEFYMLSKRTKQHAQPLEIEAIRTACRQLISEEGTARSELLQQTVMLLQQYFGQLSRRLPQADGATGAPNSSSSAASTGGSTGPAASGPGGGAAGIGRSAGGELLGPLRGVVEPVDDGPRAERKCFDRHPQCGLWVSKGECEHNPVYMVGPEQKEEDGWCRAACGVCQAPPAAPHDLPDADAHAMQEAQASLLAALQAGACVKAAACKWAQGEGMAAVLAKAKKGADKEAAELLEAAEFVSGPVQAETATMAAALDGTRLKQSRPANVLPLSRAIVPHKGGGRKEGAPEPLPAGAAQLLWRELGAKCVYVSTGWWWYEVCPWHHIYQYHQTGKTHDDGKPEVDWSISLGSWAGSAWAPNATTLSGLFPHHAKVPYVVQAFSSGDKCERDPEPGTAKPRPDVPRSTELRFACSPDSDMHLTVAEPDQCTYIVELYLPELCSLKEFAVEPPPGGWIALRTTATGAAEDEEAARFQLEYGLPQEDPDDDPYVDPDDDVYAP